MTGRGGEEPDHSEGRKGLEGEKNLKTIEGRKLQSIRTPGI